MDCQKLNIMVILGKNIRPRQGNRSRDVENEEIRERIRPIVNKYMA